MVLMVLAVVARGAGGRENSDEDEGAEDARAGHELLRPPIVYGVRHTMIRASIPEGAMRNVMAFVALGIAVMASPVAAEEPRPAAPAAGELTAQIGRASCRERVESSVGAAAVERKRSAGVDSAD